MSLKILAKDPQSKENAQNTIVQILGTDYGKLKELENKPPWYYTEPWSATSSAQAYAGLQANIARINPSCEICPMHEADYRSPDYKHVWIYAADDRTFQGDIILARIKETMTRPHIRYVYTSWNRSVDIGFLGEAYDSPSKLNHHTQQHYVVECCFPGKQLNNALDYYRKKVIAPNFTAEDLAVEAEPFKRCFLYNRAFSSFPSAAWINHSLDLLVPLFEKIIIFDNAANFSSWIGVARGLSLSYFIDFVDDAGEGRLMLMVLKLRGS
jgi:hypothetical protein